MIKRKTVFIMLLLLLLTPVYCSCGRTPSNEGSRAASGSVAVLEPFSDVRGLQGTITLKSGEYLPEDIKTYWFNENTVFEGNETLAAAILENGKDPGLGIYQLHAEGITGRNVTVAVIDQPLLPDHPEYAGRIAAYYPVNFENNDNPSSMHGPAVASLLAGKTVGTAPGVSLYYAAIKTWERNAPKMGAKALDWLIEQNEKLPAANKIRAVSVSIDFTDADSFDDPQAWEDAVKRAQEADILVLDCRRDYDTCVFAPSFFDPDNRNDVTSSSIGAPNGYFKACPPQALGTPVGYRTVAEVYLEGEYSFSYDAIGGHSWAIPYGTGVLALGWQLNPSLTGKEMLALMRQTAYINSAGERFLEPKAFIEAVRGTLK